MIFLTLEATLINELDFISYLSRRVLYASYVREPHILQGFVMWQIQAECWENTRKLSVAIDLQAFRVLLS